MSARPPHLYQSGGSPNGPGLFHPALKSSQFFPMAGNSLARIQGGRKHE